MTKSKKQEEKQGRNISPFYLELTKIGAKSRAFISSVRSVEEFSSEQIVLKLYKGALKISGTGLLLSVYENRSVEICGEIFSLEIL